MSSSDTSPWTRTRRPLAGLRRVVPAPRRAGPPGVLSRRRLPVPAGSLAARFRRALFRATPRRRSHALFRDTPLASPTPRRAAPDLFPAAPRHSATPFRDTPLAAPPALSRQNSLPSAKSFS